MASSVVDWRGMPKREKHYVCTSCGHIEAKWLGQCPSCGEWNTLEERGVPRGGSSHKTSARGGSGSRPLHEIDPEYRSRISTGLAELDRALGGGLLPGTSILVGGEPGIGKSTLLLQACGRIAGSSCLYVSAEESAAQIRRRADRVGVTSEGIRVLAATRIEEIIAELDRLTPRFVAIDSIQTIVTEQVGQIPGTPNQIKYVAHELADWARRNDSAVVLVAHVTKEGQIAGPKVVEHLVDAVLMFEQSDGELRFLRAVKNRFGAIEELGIFVMGANGLEELRDPARAFVSGNRSTQPAGVIAAPCYEGSRVLVVEIQALTVPAKGGVSRAFSDRIDNRRVNRVAAVLEKHLGIPLADQDVYINVAGGIRVQDVATDLALALALYSARSGEPVPAGLVATGELSLAGEVRPVSHRDQRLRAATDLGFTQVVGPPSQDRAEEGWHVVDTVRAAVGASFKNLRKQER